MVQLESPADMSFTQFPVEDDEIYGQSDSDEEMMPTPFTFRSRLSLAAGRVSKCHWCKQQTADHELSLVSQDKTTRCFCSESCQDNFKEEMLKNKVVRG